MRASSSICKLNKFGYMPVMSTITGLGRALLGIIHTIVHLVSAIFDRQNQAQHVQESTLGAKNIARGIVEAIPIAGNLAMYITDEIRIHKFIDMDEERRESNRAARNNDEIVILSAYGEEIAQKPQAQITQALGALNRPVTLADFNNTITAPNRVIFS